ncbi:MAG: geranylgeranylglyceryl/heptaprenylglyceryl phosphate synthase, partial [Saprospiraceae bacterium]
DKIIRLAESASVDCFFVGGSLVVNNVMNDCIKRIRQVSNIPIIIFPGSTLQINYNADAILFLSLISGRNPDLLIGRHVESAPILHRSKLEVISTGYMLIDGGKPTTATYISNTLPIPRNKSDIALCTALAGELLGMKTIFMDAGSGAELPVPTNMIQTVSSQISIPLIVGGGIRTPEKAAKNVAAGADVIVIGNAIEKEPSLLLELADAVHSTLKINY